MKMKLIIAAISLISLAAIAEVNPIWVLTESENAATTLNQTFDFSKEANPEIKFDFQILKSEAGSLYLEASSDGGKTWDFLWAISGKLGEEWFSQRVLLADYAGKTEVQVRFRSSAGSDFKGDLALKNIKIQTAPEIDPAACAAL